ncbi:MAG: dienelactone hydrolase family protein [Rhodospirillales bacterium]|nr:dienelactone hydrolase family protein [Rhodospirillales bacterium]
MGTTIQLTAADGHKLAAYRADPAGKPRGGIVVVQEIFGVNGHIRGVCDGFAADGYAVVAPALFDRVRPGIELGYAEADIASGREVRGKIPWEQALADLRAAMDALDGAGRRGIVGYCWGGSVAWLAATRLDGLAAAVSYYGAQIAPFAAEQPRCPALLHFGETDHSIPLADVDKLRAAQAGNPVEIHLYPAGHGFNCEARASHHPASAARARERTLAFFRQHVG